MSGLRAVIVIAVPAVTAIFGLLWLMSRKRPPSQRKPPDKHGSSSEQTQSSTQSEQNSSHQNAKSGKSIREPALVSKVPDGRSDADSVRKLKVVDTSGDKGIVLSQKSLGESKNSKLESSKTAAVSLDKSEIDQIPSGIESQIITASETAVTEAKSKLYVGKDNTMSTKFEKPVHDVEEKLQASLLKSVSQMENKSQEPLLVEETITPCNAGTVNAASPSPAQSFTSALSQSLSNSLNTDNVVKCVEVKQNNIVPESSSRSNESKNECNGNLSLELQSDSMTRSWHEEVSDEENESYDLHGNSVGAQDSEQTSNVANVQNTSVNNNSERVSEQSISNGDESSSSSHHPIAENGAETQGTATGSSGAKSKKKLEQQCNQTDNSANCDNLSEVNVRK